MTTLEEHEERAVGLGYILGFGRMMQLSSEAWGKSLAEQGIPGGQLTVGTCASFLVECPGCAEARERGDHCDWCCGNGRVTKKVADIIISIQGPSLDESGPERPTEEQMKFFGRPGKGKYLQAPSYAVDLLLGKARWHLYWDGTGVDIQKVVFGLSNHYGWPGHREEWELPKLIIRTAERIAAKAMNSQDKLEPTVETKGPSRWEVLG